MVELARDSLHHQLAFADALDAKLATLFAAGSALVGLLAAVLAFGSASHTPARATLLAIGIAQYLLLTGLWWKAGKPQWFDTGPQVMDTAEGKGALALAAELDDAGLANDLILSYEAYYEQNRPTMDVKTKAVKVGFVLVALETLALAAAGGFALL